ncbi:hypothetical protein HYH03_001280 [Edaphochlamys debaryana]|uniref:Protein kinase domain-containing protein n=1 Tax=Edaphochlamys debaryana TaxID=47281 RepID=A0A836C6A0_9CHLO|nr:hypothetical protein HYH03_001280 [Edaphochlamys debaryana]|eukprot:KAG2500502.1 hypothetical protein HYH03_001280 [Edaphochlamys debaryana]
MRLALANPNVTSVFVYQNTTLSYGDFNFANSVNLTAPRAVQLYGCVGTQVDVNQNWTRAGITVGWGASLSISGLTFTNTYLMNQLLWPRYFAPLLSLVDTTLGGVCSLSSVTLLTPDKSNLALYMAEYANSTSLSGDALPVYTAAPNGTAVSIARWVLSGASFWPPSPGISPAVAASSRWELTNVGVYTQPFTQCLSSTGIPGVSVRSGAELRQLLSDPLIPAIQVVNDITFVASEWPPETSGPADGQLFVNGTKEVYACHPNPTGRYTIDFGNLGQMVFVFGTLRWRGSLYMTNPRASPRRSWLYLLIGALSVETDGVIDFQGVEIHSTVPSPFSNADDPFWNVQCGSLCPSFIPNKNGYRNISYYDAFIYDYRFYKTDWVAVSQGRNITGTGFWGYTDVALTWRPTASPPPPPPVAAPGGGDSGPNVVAIAVPVAVGGTLLIAGLVGLVFWLKRRKGAEAAAAAAGASGSNKGAGATPSAPHDPRAPGGLDSSSPPGSSSNAPQPGANSVAGSQTVASVLSGSAPTEARIEDMKRALNAQGATGGMRSNEQISLTELLGEGTFGKVFKGTWRGTTVAVKTMVLPTNMSGKEKREKMAVMETAISSSLSHPNIVQTYTYAVIPVKGEQDAMNSKLGTGGSMTVESTSPLSLTSGDTGVHSWEVRLVLEFCDRGSLRDVLNDALRLAVAVAASASGAGATAAHTNGGAGGEGKDEDEEGGSGGSGSPLRSPGRPPELRLQLAGHGEEGTGAAGAGGSENSSQFGQVLPPQPCASCPLGYVEVLDVCLDVARAMLHMHSENIVHGDLKARNILLKSGGTGDGRNYTSKVADFGLSLRIDPTETHVSNVYQGTITHMAPEVLLHGKVSKSSDVYAFAILMWEAYTAGQAFKGTPRALLGHEVTKMNRRPQFPLDTPFEFQLLVCRCWESDPSIRPSFDQIISELTRMRAKVMAAGGASAGVVGRHGPVGGAMGGSAANPSAATSAAGHGAGLMPPVPRTPALQYPVGASVPSVTLGSESVGLGPDTGSSGPGIPQDLFYVQNVDGSTMNTMSVTDSLAAPHGAGVGVGMGVGVGPGIPRPGPPPAMPPIFESSTPTQASPETSAPLPAPGQGQAPPPRVPAP